MADIELLRQLLISNSHRGHFELTSRSKVVDWYVDVRPLLLDSTTLRTIGRLFFSRLECDVVVGAGISGSLLVSALLSYTCKPLKGLIVRDGPRKHGLQKIVEGDPLIHSCGVTFVDDVFTTGSTLKRVISNLESDRRCTIKQGLVLVDRSTTPTLVGVPVLAFFKASSEGELTYRGDMVK